MFSRRKWFSWPAVAAASGKANPANAQAQANPSDLAAAIAGMEVINSHEHIIPETERTSHPVDFFTLAGHYAMNDVVSAGLPPDAQKELGRQEVPAKSDGRCSSRIGTTRASRVTDRRSGSPSEIFTASRRSPARR